MYPPTESSALQVSQLHKVLIIIMNKMFKISVTMSLTVSRALYKIDRNNNAWLALTVSYQSAGTVPDFS